MSDKRYLVAARKYRPTRFNEVVAQEHVTETLKNAIRLDRLGHAYLFSGTRGVGKTTAARILAKAINCTTPREERGDQAEPCGECDSCQSFQAGRSLNIFEMDAASNNSVEDIRELNDKVRVPPQGGRKKVYIIDEVHMLSKSAFNAFLKTLEEPPPHTLFIFATTEPHKVLPTILSRCQRFDFRRIPTSEIVAHLRYICDSEGITADEASLLLIARKGDGALRDALSAFDQAVSLCGTDLKYDDLVDALGLVDVDRYFDVTTYIIDRNNAALLELADELVSVGYDMQEFLTGLAEHLRNIMVARSTGDTHLIEATVPIRERYARTAKAFEEPDLLRLLMIVADTEERLRTSVQPRLQFELALLKMAGLARATDLRETLDRLSRIEQMAAERQSAGGAAEPESSYNPANSSDGDDEPPVSSQKHPAPSEPEQEPSAAASAAASGSSSLAGSTPEQKAQVLEDPASPPETSDDDPGLFNPPALQPPPAGPNDRAEASTDASTAALTSDVTLEVPDASVLEKEWPQFIQTVQRRRVRIGAILLDASLVAVRGTTAVLAVPKRFHKDILLKEKAYLLNTLQEIADRQITDLEIQVRKLPEAGPTTDTESELDPRGYMEKKRKEDPVIRAIFEQFGGELVW